MKVPIEHHSADLETFPVNSPSRFQRWPWLPLQIIAANVFIVLALAVAWYLVFTEQSSVYSERLMAAFDIEPGSLHAMYVEDVEQQLWMSVFVGMIFAVLASIGLAFLIARPLRLLANTTERLRYGDYRVRSTIQRGEVGQLAENVNALAYALEQEEQRRAQFMKDLGHELRTPIMSLRGYTEGLEDGIFEADESYFQLMTSEFKHLTALTHTIETMRLDSASGDEIESHTKTDVVDTIKNAENRWHSRFQQRSLILNTEIPSEFSGTCIAASDRSVQQIIDNLLSNMLRYANPSAECFIRAGIGSDKDMISLLFSNDAPEVTAEVLPFLFDRFFRVSDSRTRLGDAHPRGLGLSVVKQLCIANGGHVSASLNSGRLAITVNLPMQELGFARH